MIHYYIEKRIPERLISEDGYVYTPTHHDFAEESLATDHIVGVDTETGEIVSCKEVVEKNKSEKTTPITQDIEEDHYDLLLTTDPPQYKSSKTGRIEKYPF